MEGRRRSGASLAWSLGLLASLSLWLTAAAGAGPSFEGQGRITAVDPGRGTVTIEHGGIAGLLPPTRSEFPVQGRGMIEGARAGDRVRFTLSAADDSHGLLVITSLTAESPSSAGWRDGLMPSLVAVLGLLILAVMVAAGYLLWHQLRSLERRVVALDHEAGMLRGLVTDTQDGVREIAHALEETATALRIGYVQELRRRLIPGTAPPASETASDKATGETAAGLIVIQRGRGELFRAVERGAAGPGLAVIWDRRRSDRRRNARRVATPERRHTDRRGAPSETWTRLGFQLVPGVAEIPRPPRMLRPVSVERAAPR
jgi:Cu/Ag efflux protein CusF